MNTLERKRKFVFQLLLDPEDRMKAGLAAYPEQSLFHHEMAKQVAIDWCEPDEEIAQCKKELLEEYGPEFFLPTKYDLAREVYKIVKAGRTHDDRLKAGKLYGEVMGFIEKPSVNNGVINAQQTTNKVMLVPTSASDDAWEERMLKQQAALIEVATE